MIHRRDLIKAAAGMAGLGMLPGAWAAPAAAVGTAEAALTLPQAINKAGRQRMLSQRCAKAWLMQALGVAPEMAGPLLQSSMSLFETQMSELSRLQPTTEVQTALVQLAADWQSYRTVLLSPPSPEVAAQLYARNEAVLGAAHAATLAYERSSGSPVGHLINVAGRQRMLSQRMAKFVFFARYGVESKAAVAALAKAREEFIAAFSLLKAAPQNSARITSELALADQQWFFFENALSQDNSPKALKAVATTSERILEQLNLVVGLYETLATQG
ncbi:type IV pili methyl-accepting chemotaxis transducer N-terminal domain-containing protein [Denitromonas iodatirespirans]|uniref:Type IV pili methyl-accepting chemotaxis transducer N-terminal domain-containing protein n=1 Tax=Denitromonas iodatirespirans TaxID=2795389 RepID=A0A944H8S4_DENI1|nr:type IV pili methyl-accepting chemotaxis transducer N-terminal domain-containing protein [Denitromonas iodatirespirans]MBT0962514.1 type IV pili methyl-accepting chemotaxis transducer N-terminal domain-containing protein [Denitromonas iodatirespirans]